MVYPSIESVQDFITDLINAKSYEKPEVTVSLHDNVYSIPIHRRMQPWASRASVEVVHRPDSWLEVAWVKVR